jgi:hypothetical protein
MLLVLPTPLYEGNAVTCVETFVVPPVPYNGQPPSSWTATDPTVVTLTFVVGGGSPTVWTYGGTGSIVKVSTGVYSAELDTSDAPGTWQVKWVGTDACAAVDIGSFPVVAVPF